MDGKTLRIVRRSCGLRLVDLAKLTGYNISYLSMMENDLKPISESARRKLMAALPVDMNEIRVIIAVHDSIKSVAKEAR